MIDYQVIDKVRGDTLTTGDFVLIDGEVIEILIVLDEYESHVSVYNHSNGDDYLIEIDPDTYYDLLGD